MFGVRQPVILFRHIFRNSVTPIIVQATVDLGTVILAVGALAFLGLGAQPPAADWGLMVADGRTTVLTEWWIATFPGLAIFLVVLGFNLLGDAVRDVLDPRRLAMSQLLAIDDLRVAFDQNGTTAPALRGISLDVGVGEVVGVVGETGCGKTLTGLSVLRLLPTNAHMSGSIRFDGIELTDLPDSELRSLRGRAISMVFQSPTASFNPVFTIGDQLEQVARTHLPLRRKDAGALVTETLGEVGLPAPDRIKHFYPHELSGGMLQRAMIAMAILCRPRLLIADEPTTALDVTVAEQILLLLRRLQGEYGFGILFISHDLELVGDFCDRVAVLYAGRVVELGTASELLHRPRHPYTHALLASLPGKVPPRTPLPAVPGGLPRRGAESTGCAFSDRCPLAEQRCIDVDPPSARVGHEHVSACHRWEDV